MFEKMQSPRFKEDDDFREKGFIKFLFISEMQFLSTRGVYVPCTSIDGQRTKILPASLSIEAWKASLSIEA